MDLFNEFKTWSNYDKMVKSGQFKEQGHSVFGYIMA